MRLEDHERHLFHPLLLVPSASSRAVFQDREEVSQYLLRIDDGNGLLMKGGILNVCPALAGRGVS
jgi:hypothetical protein